MFSYSNIDFDTLNKAGVQYRVRFFSKDPDGDQSEANINMKGNYSDAGDGKTLFSIKAQPGEIIALYRVIATVRDGGSFDSGSYGNGIILTNGITFCYKNNFVETCPTAVPIKTNPDWGIYCYDTLVSSYGSGDETLQARWTFAKMGIPFILDGDIGAEVGVYVHDDISGLVSQYVNAQAIRMPKK